MKITITLHDTDDGTVKVRFDFDPALTDETEETPALRVAMNALEDIKRQF